MTIVTSGPNRGVPVEEPSDVPFVDLLPVHRSLLPDLRAAFERVVATGSFVAGEEVQNFEAALAELVHVPRAIGVGSGTAALHLALLAAGIGPGDEVILPPNTFFATAEAVMAAGAKPVFVDVDPDTALIDPEAVNDAITPRTAAIIVVHLYGQPAAMDKLNRIAERHGLFLLEDAAQAISATWDAAPVGSLGHAAAFSFYPAKNLGALGEAGAVTTRDSDLADRVALLRQHGEAAKNVHVRFGLNERLDGLQAAFLLAKLPHLHEAQKHRLEAVACYRELLADVEEVRLLDVDRRAGHVYHLLVVRVPRRDQVFGALKAKGIGVGIHYPTPIHLQPACHFLGRRNRLPHAENLADTVLSLPLFPGISAGQIERSVDGLASALRSTL